MRVGEPGALIQLEIGRDGIVRAQLVEHRRGSRELDHGVPLTLSNDAARLDQTRKLHILVQP